MRAGELERPLIVAAIAAAAVVAAAFATPASGQSASGGDGDPRRGEEVWRKCVSCHTVVPDGHNRAGPSLHGVFGRQAGAISDYPYSEALKRSGIVWTETTLDEYLRDAEAFVPGTKMYGGLSIDRDRADLIAFLRRAVSP